jgi:hypothetical protein
MKLFVYLWNPRLHIILGFAVKNKSPRLADFEFDVIVSTAGIRHENFTYVEVKIIPQRNTSRENDDKGIERNLKPKIYSYRLVYIYKNVIP